MYIYRILCIKNNKSYIGCCKNFYIRKRTHLQHLTRNNHHSVKLQNAWNKHGSGNFVFEILKENVSKENIFDVEIDFIKKYNSFKNGYNCTTGGEGTLGRFGAEHHNSKNYYIYDLEGFYIKKILTIKSVEIFTKKKLRFNKNNYAISGNYVVSKTNKGDRFTGHHKIFKYDLKNKLVNSYVSTSYVKDFSKEEIYSSIRTKKSIRDFFWKSDVTNKQEKQFNKYKKKISMFDKKENFIKDFGSITEAYDFLEIPVNGNISKCLKGKQKSAYGYIWKEIK